MLPKIWAGITTDMEFYKRNQAMKNREKNLYIPAQRSNKVRSTVTVEVVLSPSEPS